VVQMNDAARRRLPTPTDDPFGIPLASLVGDELTDWATSPSEPSNAGPSTESSPAAGRARTRTCHTPQSRCRHRESTRRLSYRDDVVNGQPRKLIAQAARNGHFFVLDRTNGKAIVSSEFVKTNWAKGYDAKGQPIPDPAKMPQVAGAIVTPNQGGAANWPPPTFHPATGLFYVNASRAFSIYYLYDLDDNPQGWGGTDQGGYSESMLQAVDYKTGKLRWSHKWEGGGRSGLLSTAGNLVFAGGPNNALVALNATTGEALWHARLTGGVSNAPITFEMDGTQYVIVAGGDTLWAFAMYAK